MRRTKIVCTIGPASESAEMLTTLADAGMNVARLNFSHGSKEEHAQRICDIREIERRRGMPIAVLQDLPGPKLRIGEMAETITVSPNAQFIFTTRDVIGNSEEVNLPYPELILQAKPGQHIFVDDGNLDFLVESATGTDIITRVIVGGPLGSHKGVNMPGTSVSLPSVTEKDIEYLEFGLAHDIDWVAASFIRNASDLDPVRRTIEKSGKRVLLIAKIEKREAVEDIDAIIEVVDGIMIARGDLGVEIPLEEVPGVQKTIIRKCNAAGKPVITATQMLDSMIRNRRPTRAEVTDVANAIYDGTDAVMLSGETAIGAFPVEAVTVMSKIACKTESSLDYRRLWQEKAGAEAKSVTDAIAQATVDIALDLGVTAIITPTSSGATARAVSKYRPEAPIIGAAMSVETYRQLVLSWGVCPVLIAPSKNTDEMISAAVQGTLATGLVKEGDTVVVTAGVPAGLPGRTNLIKVHVVGQAVS